jgi:hypothetical protein
MRRYAPVLVSAAVLGMAALVALVSAGKSDSTATLVALGFTVLAAFGGLASVGLTWHGNRAALRGQEQMADDIKRLAELTESSIEEARAQRPDPSIQFWISHRREATEVMTIRRTRLVRHVDEDEIVNKERARALATMPKRRKNQKASGLGLLAAMGTLNLDDLPGDMTFRELAFPKKVDEYCGTLRKWISEYLAYYDFWSSVLTLDLRFENNGRVPARDLRVEVRFPHPCLEVEDGDFPSRPKPPSRPVYKSSRRAGLFIDPGHLLGFQPQQIKPFIRTNVSHPRYRQGSVIAALSVGKLLHGVPETTPEPIHIRLNQDGSYVVPWEIHAENLPAPTSGDLKLIVETSAVDGPPITTLEDLLAACRTIDTEEA